MDRAVGRGRPLGGPAEIQAYLMNADVFLSAAAAEERAPETGDALNAVVVERVNDHSMLDWDEDRFIGRNNDLFEVNLPISRRGSKKKVLL